MTTRRMTRRWLCEIRVRLQLLPVFALFGAFLPEPSRVLAAERNSGFAEGIKSYCIDFNWGPGGPNAFGAPGLWADADPQAHVQWHKELGANVIQTFAVSCNGYAWYKNGVVPEQPGLKHDFLTEMVKRGHRENMKVFGYFCVGANTRWGQLHPDESHGVPSAVHIPYTKTYIAYLCSAVEDALRRTGMDGFMADWFWHPSSMTWLPCEVEMWAELMDGPFPGKETVTEAQRLEFDRRAIVRCWTAVRAAAKQAKPDCIIWLTVSHLGDPQIVGSPLLSESDWLMNEGGSIDELKQISRQLGRGNLINCLAAWNGADPQTVVPASIEAGFGLYGFTKPVKGDILPGVNAYYLARDIDQLTGKDEANIAMLARAYRGLPFPPRLPPAVSVGKPVTVSSTWAKNPGYEADKINDGNRATRWGATETIQSAWVEIDLEAEMTIGNVHIYELADRVQAFALEYRNGKGQPWKTVFTGTTIGSVFVKQFEPVTGRYFRLNMTRSIAEPTIWEFGLDATTGK